MNSSNKVIYNGGKFWLEKDGDSVVVDCVAFLHLPSPSANLWMPEGGILRWCPWGSLECIRLRRSCVGSSVRLPTLLFPAASVHPRYHNANYFVSIWHLFARNCHVSIQDLCLSCVNLNATEGGCCCCCCGIVEMKLVILDNISSMQLIDQELWWKEIKFLSLFAELI